MTNRFNKLDGYDPEGSTVAGACPQCLRHTTLTCSSHDRLLTEEAEDAQAPQTFLLTLRCDWCSGDSVFRRVARMQRKTVAGSARRVYATVDVEQLWPAQTPRALAEEAPAIVREVFAEAALAESVGAFLLAGIGYRAAVEQIVKERGAAGNNLYERITRLVDVGASQEMVDALHEARFVGNDAAHDGLAYSADEIADIAELITEAVLVLYVQPAQRAAMAAQRAERRAAAKSAATT